MNTKQMLQLTAFTLGGLGIAIGDPIQGLSDAHISKVDPANTNFIQDVQSLKKIGEVRALIPEASTADEPAEYSVDGQSGDTAFPHARFKPLATVGEYDPATGLPLTGYPDGQAAWLADEDTVRVAYQSESYATNSNETYPWVMANGVKFTGSHIHTIDYDRAKFAGFLDNGTPASEMFKESGHLFDTVYNVFGDEVLPKAGGGVWGNQALPNGTLVDFAPTKQLSEADFFFHSFCGSHFEKANRYGSGIGFADDVWLTAEEWNIASMFTGTGTNTADTMGLASVVVDVATGVAYTVPALGQTGYEKLLPMNPGSPDYVVIICSGYNHEVEPAPLKVYVGKKGVDAAGNPVDQNDPGVPARDKFLARNGLLYGKLYGMALANSDFAALNLTADPAVKMMDNYLKDATAPETFSVKYLPTSYQWAGWGTANAVAVKDTEVNRWKNPAEQPAGFTFFNGDTKIEHPAVDPDISKFRYVQNMTDDGGLLGIEFTNLVAEISATGDLPESLSANVRRIVPATDGSLALKTGKKGIGHSGTANPDGTKTAATHIEAGVTKMVAPDGLQWIKAADADVLVVDEDSGNDYGERKYAIVIDPETLETVEDKQGYFLAMAGGSKNPRAINGVSAYGGTFERATSSEFSGTWNVTGLVARKPDGSFYSMAELAGPGELQVEQTLPLSAHKFIGVVQHSGESAGPVEAFRCDYGGQIFMFDMQLPTPALLAAHKSAIDPANTAFASDLAGAKVIGEVTALIPEASTADEASENSVDGQSGDTDYPYADFKPLATVGEYDPATGLPLTGYPDGQAAWLADEETVRVAYQSESYATNSKETYPQVMTSGATFTGSKIHTIDYDRSGFAAFMSNSAAACDMFKGSGFLFDTVYNVFGDEVLPKAAGGVWGNQALPNGTLVDFAPAKQLSQADFFFQSFCGAHYEQANKYGAGIGFADDIWLCAEEWNIASMFTGTGTDTADTMGLASVVVDVANGVAYTVPALGQTGYEKLQPMNSGSPDYVVIICSGYNHEVEPAPLKVYVGKKGVDAAGNPVDQNDPGVPARDKFLARNGLLYGKLYGMALANSDFAALNLTADPATKMMDNYLKDATAPDTFSVKYLPTSYQWAGWGTTNAVAVKDTEVGRWKDPAEQPAGYFNVKADTEIEHQAVDPDISKFRYVQNMTDDGGLLGIEFTNFVAEITATGDLPESLSANVRRIIPAIDGALTLDTGSKGIAHPGTANPDGTKTAASHVEAGVAMMVAPDGLQWIRTADADVLVVDEDSGNDYGERKYALVLNPDTLELAQPGTGWFLAMAGGSKNPRAINGVSAYGGTFGRATSSEFSGTWNVTGLIARKPDGSFHSMAELAGTGEQQVIESLPLRNQAFIGVVQHSGESAGPVDAFRCDNGGQVFMFTMNFPTLGGKVVFNPGTRGSATGGGPLEQSIRAGQSVTAPTIQPQPGWIFAGWDQKFDEVSGEMVITAQYVEEASSPDFGLYTQDSILDLRMNGVMGAVNNPGLTGTAELSIEVESGDLDGNWKKEVTQPVTVPAPAGSHFYRLNAKQP